MEKHLLGDSSPHSPCREPKLEAVARKMPLNSHLLFNLVEMKQQKDFSMEK